MKTDTPGTTQSETKSGEVAPITHQSHSWSPGSILFGLLLIFFGLLFLFENLDMLDVNLGRVWGLWPLLVIASGLSLISVRGWLSTALTAVFIVITLGLAGLVAFGLLSPGRSVETTTRSVEVSNESGDDKEARVSINGGAGRFVIASEDMSPLVKATLRSNIMTLTQKSRTENGNQTVELNVEGKEGRWWGGNYKNDLRVILSESKPVRLDISTGASSVDADLADVKLQALDIDSGASKIDIKLGERSDNTNVSIDSGMSSVILRVPKSSGVRLEIDSPMSSLDIPRLREISKDMYETENYSSAANKITVVSNIGMGSFTIEYY